MTASPPRHFLSVSIAGLLEVGAWLVVAGAWAGWLGRWWWPLDLTAHFQMIYLPLLLGALAWFGWMRKIVPALVAGATLVMVLARVVPVVAGERLEAGDASSAPRLRLLSLNVLTANREKQRVLEFILREDADVVFLMEVDSAWEAALAPLARRYPHCLMEAREDNFGVAFFSRAEVSDLRTIYLGEAAVPTVTASLLFAGREVRFVGRHPAPPVGGQYFRWQREQMALLAEHVRRLGGAGAPGG